MVLKAASCHACIWQKEHLFSICLLLEKVTRVKKKKKKSITKPSSSGSATWLLNTLVTQTMIIGTSGKNLSLTCTLGVVGVCVE